MLITIKQEQYLLKSVDSLTDFLAESGLAETDPRMETIKKIRFQLKEFVRDLHNGNI